MPATNIFKKNTIFTYLLLDHILQYLSNTIHLLYKSTHLLL